MIQEILTFRKPAKMIVIAYARPPYRWGGDHDAYETTAAWCPDHPEYEAVLRCPNCRIIGETA